MVSREEEPVTVDHGMLLPFKPLSLTFEHINYYVDVPAVGPRLLQNGFGFVHTTYRLSVRVERVVLGLSAVN